MLSRTPKPPSNIFKSITAKESRIHWNIVCEVAISESPFLIFKVWLQIRHYWRQKPPSNSFQVNYSERIQNSLKYCMRVRHIGSAILNFEILTTFSLPRILKKLMHFGNVQVRENSRTGWLILRFLINIPTQLVIKRNSFVHKVAEFNELRYWGKMPSLISPLSQFSILSTIVYILSVVLSNPFINFYNIKIPDRVT